MLYSASSYSSQMNYLIRQAIFCVAGFVGMLVISKIDYHWFAKVSVLAYWVAFGLMGLVRTPLGKEVKGARRWIKLPFDQSMQPSEVMKIAIIIFIPVLLCKAGKYIKDKKVLGKIFLWGAAAGIGVYVLTDNLSTAIIVLGIVCVMIFVAHPKTWPWIALAGGGLTLAGIGVWFLDAMMDTSNSFRLRRVLVWLHPEEYLSDGGYQVMQGLYAIGSGGFFGKGLGNSAQKVVIPEAHNDMILSIICEELG
ncbi:MAG: FtsW/RodA/SpoVE family cell cycle protein, partial [Tyzzerella sp.]|nr:FtsW/RodA/SpoVE family cell cycle protein [Tyzzerella sp.]